MIKVLMNKSSTVPIIIIIVAVLLVFCLCLCGLAFLAYTTITSSSISIDGNNTFYLGKPTPGNTPLVIRPPREAAEPPVQSTDPVEGTDTPNSPAPPVIDPNANLQVLQSIEVPVNDPYELAHRMEGKKNISPTLEPPVSTRQVGEGDSFWVSNSETNDYFQTQATLRLVTDHVYFWISDNVDYRQSDLEALADTFEYKIYPTNRAFFGSEWTPGVDGDPHIYILYTGGVGGSVAGYFSSTDSLNPAINQYSNGHDLFVFNADIVSLDEEYTYGVLAHEFQHMILWHRDRNESTWMNEGFSDLAMLLNGYNIGGHDIVYTADPDLQLNDWADDHENTTPHYGASFLFMTYLLDHLGEEITKALVGYTVDGLEGIDGLLVERNITDPLTGKTLSADDLFRDWTVASYLQDATVSDGRYTYGNYPEAPQPSETETIHNCDSELQTREVHQYGVDYIRLECREDAILNFEGSIQVKLLPADPHSGNYAFWSNMGDESDMTLTRRFDFTGHEGSLTLDYWTWYDIEEDYDYAYVLASEDGEHWEILHTPSGSAEDPTGANFGWGYTGTSGDDPRWIQESVDVSRFAGKEVYLRFEYITDAAVNGDGMLVDDISIPQIGYNTDFEKDDGGWEAAGFTHVQNLLPQDFLLTMITLGDQTTVERVELSPDKSAQIPLKFSGGRNDVILIVSGATRYTNEPAAYRFYFQP